MAQFDFEAQRGRAWWASFGLVALTVAAGNTCLFYIRNLDEIRKVYLGKILLTGTQSAAWRFWMQPTAALTEAALGNFMNIQNADFQFVGPDGIDGDVNVVLKCGNDGGDRVGGAGSVAVLTRSYETLPIEIDGAVALGQGDTFAIVVDPLENGDFACSVGFWQIQDPRHR